MIQKFIKIKMRDKTSITLPIEQAEQVLTSTQQIIMLYDEEGKWTGESLNKAEIVGTQRDYDQERIFNHRLPELPSGEKDVVEISKLLKDYRPEFLNEKH